MTEVPKNESISDYKIKSVWKDLQIQTKDGTLYYARYPLAQQSEYFRKLFESGMLESKELIIDMTEYNTDVVIEFLNIINDYNAFDFCGINPVGNKLNDTNTTRMKEIFQLLVFYQFDSLINIGLDMFS